MPFWHSCFAVVEPAAEKDTEVDSPQQVFVAFARVYSGCVHQGQKLYVLGPKHSPALALQKVFNYNHLHYI